tara:strand:+ start:231 stop:377 length:147 start_codon:yes stop_codon:yes gene_type:complete
MQAALFHNVGQGGGGDGGDAGLSIARKSDLTHIDRTDQVVSQHVVPEE